MEFAFSSSAVNNALVADWRTDTHFVSQQSSVLRRTDVEITLLRPPTELGPVRICVRVIGRLSEVDKPPKSVTHGRCNRSSGVALAMRHRLFGLSIYGLTALRREMSTPPTLLMDYGTLYFYL